MKVLRRSVNIMSLLRLVLLSGVAAMADGYILDQDDSSSLLSLRLTDVETNIAPVSLLFQNKKSKITVNGLSWSADETTETSSVLNYTTYVNNKSVENGSILLSRNPLELPLSIDAGTVTANDSSTLIIRVVLNDGNRESVAEMQVNAYRSWAASIPIVVAFVMFLILRAHMVHSLFVAMFLGSWIIEGSLVSGFRAIFDTYILNAISNSYHMSILTYIVSTYVLMEMVNKSGGTNEFLRVLSPYTSRARIAQLVLFVLGVLTYFDPFASILVLGKVFGSVLKGFPVSSEKFAFLVDTTALPVSSIIPGSTWIISTGNLVQDGIDLALGQKENDAVEDNNGKSMLISSIKYQFYPVLILFLTVLQLMLSREAGPILKSENESRSNYGNMEQELETALSAIRRETAKPERSWNWWVPVLILNITLWSAFIQYDTDTNHEALTETVMISGFMTSTAATGILVQFIFLFQPLEKMSFRWLMFWRIDEERMAFLTDTFPSGSASIPHAITSKSDGLEQNHIDNDFGDLIEGPKNMMTTYETSLDRSHCRKCLWRKYASVLSLQEGVQCLHEGITSSVPVIVSLVSTWSVSEVYVALGVDRIVVGWILDESIAAEKLPIVAFFSAFLLSLVLGSSWLAVSLMIPAVSMSLMGIMDLEMDAYLLVLGSILSGAVAGDHIGPFSETTILSAFTTGCGVRRHCITQAPYAISVFLLSFLVGTLPLSYGTFPEFFGFFIGSTVILIVVIVRCRRVQKPRFIPGRGGEAITKELHPLQKGPNNSSHQKCIPERMIMPVDTDDLIDREEDQTVARNESQSNIEQTQERKKNEFLATRTYTLQSFKGKLQELSIGSGDPVLGLVEEGLLPSCIKNDQMSATRPDQVEKQSIRRDISGGSKKRSFESKKRLIEATIQSSEKEGNIFSESLRLFLRTAETKLDQIMSEGSIDIQVSGSGDSGDDSLDNLMLDIAAKGWKSAVKDIVGDDCETEMTGTGEGNTTAGDYTTAGEYTTDGFGSMMEESDDSVSTTSSSSRGDGQSTAFTTDNEDSYSNGENTAATSNGQSLSASEGIQDTSMLINPLAFNKSHKVFAWMGAHRGSGDETETDYESTKDHTKASF